MKTCSKCKKELNLDNFVRDKQKLSGYYSQCKACKREYLSRNKGHISKQRSVYWDNNKGVLSKKAKVYRQENKGKLSEYSAEYRANNPHKLKAYQLLRDSFRYGNNTKPLNCTKCGNNSKLEAHHEDYTKPLDVLWLCRSCHKKHHVCLSQNKKIALIEH